MKVWSSQSIKKNFFLFLYLGSWSLLTLIWLDFLIKVLNTTITFADVRVGRVVAWGGGAFVLSFIPVLHIILFLYWYIKTWRTKNNLIYILTCLLIIIISLVWSSNHISRGVEKDKILNHMTMQTFINSQDLYHTRDS